ncbi:hypothetical protein SAMN04488543_0099 [Friedmanniella luteola]|uniref:ANTAR domain-containing protein n=2 Tax=Friedmanniella luteola TaxID=546871 RepID=A0A1H1L7J8_9ACTN|nr:hypothetical protein SAMN04488543_0099 [Friedmanniella luteola]
MLPLRQRYRDVLQRSNLDGPGAAATLPQILTLACVEVLPVAGAGLSLTGELRVPLSASNVAAAEAERLQVSLGDGPCLEAAAGARPVAVDADRLGRRWPVYAHELRRRTPFRSVASLPLTWPTGRAFAALDLYSTDPSGPFDDLAEVQAALVPATTAVLLEQRDWLLGPAEQPEHDPAAGRRMAVWSAVGMLMVAADATYDDALALLRSYAFSCDLDLDTAARLLLQHTVTTDDVLTPP